VFDATDLAFGVNWEFRRTRMGDYLAGYVTPHPADWPLARAVAASNCFPPLFQPMPIRFPIDRFRDAHAQGQAGHQEALSNLRLTDGGNYDNLGLEPIWKSREVVLVSDGGGSFDYEPDRKLLWRIQRHPSILDNQLRSLHKRWLDASFDGKVFRGAYWRIPNTRATYLDGDTLGYSADLAENFLTHIRTDLNGFNEAEGKILENHGYLVADAAVRRWLCDLVGKPWPEVRPPHAEWLQPQKTECQIKQVLFPGYDCASERAAKRGGEPGGPG
jgi:NTE family protein